MKRLWWVSFVLTTVLVGVAVGLWSGGATAAPNDTGSIISISNSSSGAQGNESSLAPVISGNGRFIAFWSFATNLVPGDTNNIPDVFVYDRISGATSRVSVDSNGTQADAASEPFSLDISTDGRYVAFISHASNLVPGDTNDRRDVFVRDRQSGTTDRVSIASDGAQGNGDAYGLAISADGRFVTFASAASNLVPDDINGVSDIFIHDRQSRNTSLVSVASDDTPGNSGSFLPALSADGRYVAFWSSASNLVSEDKNGWSRDVFIHDRQVGVTTRFAVELHQVLPSALTLSDDGRYVGYAYYADTSDPYNDAWGAEQIVVRHIQTGTTTLISDELSPAPVDSPNGQVALSADGRFVVYSSDIRSDGSYGNNDISVLDQQTGQTAVITQQGDVSSRSPVVSDDGHFIAFSTWSSNLIPCDMNEASDIFVYDQDGQAPSEFSVCGTVTTSDGMPLPGVIVSTASGHATTDARGNYTITGLPAGTYTVLPEKTGHTFSPPSRTITVPPDAVRQNFKSGVDMAQDTDGDGLPDEWEFNGYDHDSDGIIDVDLPSMGADPLHKDIFVEIDYMAEELCLPLSNICHSFHTHKPKDEAIKTVINAFANAPVSNPDRTRGISLHVDYGANSIMNPQTGKKWGERSQSNILPHVDSLGTAIQWYTGNWWDFDAIKDEHFAAAREPIFHYALFVHNLEGPKPGTSGVSRGIPARDFIISLGEWADGNGTTMDQASTFMHELGHNLGLDHGGNDSVNHKPNYLSVMNYSYQTTGLFYDGHNGLIDYSDSTLQTLDERALNETQGLGSSNYGVRYWCMDDDEKIDLSVRSIDWNCDGQDISSSVETSINRDKTFAELTSFNDWANLDFSGIALDSFIRSSSFKAEMEFVEELTEDEASMMTKLYGLVVTVSTATESVHDDLLTYTFTITNTGEYPDEYSISVVSTYNWANLNSVPSSVRLAGMESIDIVITVTPPDSVIHDSINELRITATSLLNPYVSDEASVYTIVSSEITPSPTATPSPTPTGTPPTPTPTPTPTATRPPGGHSLLLPFISGAP